MSDDLDAADRVARVAFGTHVGLATPVTFFGDADFIRSRWRADPTAAFGAAVGGAVIGSSFASNWGTVGFLGPVTVDPAYWGQSVAKRLVESTMEVFDGWGTRHVGLFTFADSPKHLALYQRYGFWPRFLTSVMSAAVDGRAPSAGRLLSSVPATDRPATMDSLRALTDAVHPGLDLTREVTAVADQGLGDTVLIDDGTGLTGLAVCHVGPGTEAGSGHCYVKFAAVLPGRQARQRLFELLDACTALAVDRGASILIAGVNAGRPQAWSALSERGFRPRLLGVTMHRPNEPGYSTSGSYVLDDWR